jgi:hypothetical protein
MYRLAWRSLSGNAVEKPSNDLAARLGLQPGTLPSEPVPQLGGGTGGPTV